MKIISTHPAHQDEVRTTGKAVINGITFTAGEEGLPTSEDVHDSKCEMFVGVPGFRFIDSRDGHLVGETGVKDNRTSLDAVTSALQSGEITLDELRVMNLEIPGVGRLNGLIDKALDPQHSRAQEGTPSPAEVQEAAEIAASLGVPASDVKVLGDDIILSGRAAQIAGEGLTAAQADGPSAGDVEATFEEGSESEKAEGGKADDSDKDDDGDDKDGDGDEEGTLTKAQIKALLTERGVAFSPRDNRADLLTKLHASDPQ